LDGRPDERAVPGTKTGPGRRGTATAAGTTVALQRGSGGPGDREREREERENQGRSVPSGPVNSHVVTEQHPEANKKGKYEKGHANKNTPL